MPQQLPNGFGDANWKEGGSFTSMEGLHDVTIFTAEPVNSGKGKPGFKLTMRIDGGPFDGEDLIERFAGLTADTIFRTHDVLKAAGILDNYYKRNEDGKSGVWVAVPTKDEMEGLKFQVLVQNEPWQGTDRETKAPAFNEGGSPRMLDANRVTRYYPLGEAVDISKVPPLKPRYEKGVDPSVPFGGLPAAGQGGFGAGAAPAGGFGQQAGAASTPNPFQTPGATPGQAPAGGSPW